MLLDQGTIISKWQQELEDHAERMNNVLDIPIKLRETQMENKKQNKNVCLILTKNTVLPKKEFYLYVPHVSLEYM